MIEKLLTDSTLTMLTLGTLLVVISVLLLNRVFYPTMDDTQWREEIHRVREGESLWTLSGEHCPKSVDRREWIREVQTLNDLRGGNIQTGQKLIILTPERRKK